MADFTCAEHGKTFATEARLKAHLRMTGHKGGSGAAAAVAKKIAETPQQVLAKAVENARTVGAALAGSFAPHVGVAIAGVQHEKTGAFIVPSRAVMAGNLLRARVEKDARLVALLMLFNRMFEVPEGLTLAGSMVAAIAVDTGRVSPDVTFEFPIAGRKIPIQPVKLVLSDVLDYVAEHSEPAPPAEPPSANGSGNPNLKYPVTTGVEAT